MDVIELFIVCYKFIEDKNNMPVIYHTAIHGMHKYTCTTNIRLLCGLNYGVVMV